MLMATTLRRALLYVPASSQKMLDKSRNLTVDTVAYDLEDSVTAGKKEEARRKLSSFLQQPRAKAVKEQAVRINPVRSGLALDDLKAVLEAPHVDAIVVPKVNSASDLQFVSDVLKDILPKRHGTGTKSEGASAKEPLKILALIESAKAIMDLSSICKASPYLSGLIFAAEDFALDLSITRTPSLLEFLYARSAIVAAARAYSLPSTIDLVCTSFRGEEGLRTLEEECLNGRGLGFNGKQCIHPSQVELVQQFFAPSPKDTEWAVRLLIAEEKATRQGRGAWTFHGSMVDAPVIGKAKSIIKRAEACDQDLTDLRKEWQHEEPE